MTSSKKHGRGWRRHFSLFLFSMFILNTSTNANELLPVKTSLITSNLQQLSMPPVTPAKNLNTDKVALGETLFRDVRLSRDNTISCVSGHLLCDNGADHRQYDQRRFNITGNEADRHVFRVPGLRLAALTEACFHDGSIKTLDEAVKIMAKHQLGRETTDQDIHYIVAFLKTLPGEYKGRPLLAGHQTHEPDGAL